MLVTQARIEANRRNSQRSTGPKTAEGKESSRANALKHGLCSKVAVVEDETQIQERAAGFHETFAPQNDFQRWLVNQAATLTLRIERGERIEQATRDKLAFRAAICWDDDRKVEASVLGAKLAKQPEVVASKLRSTHQGCEWMISRWILLLNATFTRGSWTPEQSLLAFDLLGTPTAFREGHEPGEILDAHGQALSGADDQAVVARREIAALQARRELTEGLDQADRARAEADLGDDSDPELRRLRRYETALHRQLRWTLEQLEAPAQEEEAPDETKPLSPDEEPPAEASPAPIREPEPVVAPGSRVEKRLKKAEGRREARLRKLEKRLG
jgi:hypothetical protein